MSFFLTCVVSEHLLTILVYQTIYLDLANDLKAKIPCKHFFHLREGCGENIPAFLIVRVNTNISSLKSYSSSSPHLPLPPPCLVTEHLSVLPPSLTFSSEAAPEDLCCPPVFSSAWPSAMFRAQSNAVYNSQLLVCFCVLQV